MEEGGDRDDGYILMTLGLVMGCVPGGFLNLALFFPMVTDKNDGDDDCLFVSLLNV